jgi:hypothetical protein
VNICNIEKFNSALFVEFFALKTLKERRENKDVKQENKNVKDVKTKT